MTDPPAVPDAAVQITAEVLTTLRPEYTWPGTSRAVVSALARAGWLCDPGVVERDRDAARAEIDRLASELRDLHAKFNDRYAAALDTTPVVGTTSGEET